MELKYLGKIVFNDGNEFQLNAHAHTMLQAAGALYVKRHTLAACIHDAVKANIIETPDLYYVNYDLLFADGEAYVNDEVWYDKKEIGEFPYLRNIDQLPACMAGAIMKAVTMQTLAKYNSERYKDMRQASKQKQALVCVVCDRPLKELEPNTYACNQGHGVKLYHNPQNSWLEQD